MLGSEVRAKSKSPGLAQNTWAMVDIVIPPSVAAVEASTAPTASPNTSQPAPAASVPSQSRKKRAAPAAGFSASTTQPSPATPQPTPPDVGPLQLPQHLQSRRAEAEREQMRQYARERFGSRAVEALNALELWACYGDMYGEARAPWTSDTQEYRAQRALRFLRAGV